MRLEEMEYSAMAPSPSKVPPTGYPEFAVRMKDVDHARFHAGVHREGVEALGSAEEKLAYFNGVLRAQSFLEADTKQGD